MLLLAALAVATSIQGCGDRAGPDHGKDPTPARLRLSADSVFVPQQSTIRLIVTVLDAGGAELTGFAPRFVSADTAIATVSADGTVTSIGPQGRTVVTVQAAGFASAVPVIVTPVPASLDVTPTTLTIAQKDSAQLTVSVRDALGAPVPASVVVYSGNAAGGIVVRPTGLVVSLGPVVSGQVEVRAGAVTATIPVTVVQKPASVTVTPGGNVAVFERATKQFTAEVRDLNGDPVAGASVTWATSSALASVSSTGLVTAGATPGTVTLTATHHSDKFGDVVGTATVSVIQKDPPAAVVPADLTTINTGGYPRDAAIASSGKVIAVSGAGPCCDAAIWTTDLATFTGVATLSHAGSPLNVRMNAPGTLAYVAGAAPTPGQGWGVGILDVASGTQVGYLEHGNLGQPYSVGLSNDGRRAIMGTNVGHLAIFDITTGAWRKTVTFSNSPFNHIAAHPTQAKMYASAFFGSASVVEIDLTTETARVLPVPVLKAQGLAVSSDGKQLFVADENAGMQVWDLTTNTSAGSIPAASGGFGLTLSPDGKTLYQIGGQVLVIDVASHVVTKTYAIPGAVRAGISADGSILVVATEGGQLHRFAP